MGLAADIEIVSASDSPADRVAVGCFRSVAEAADRGLVILALGLCYWLESREDGHSLWVEREHESAVRTQLAKYEAECAHWPPPPYDQAVRSAHAGLLLTTWALALVTSYWVQVRWPVWTEAGALRPTEIFVLGEWWRPITALFLHGDVGHLLSNALAGAFVFSAVFGTLGRRRGLVLLTLGGALGNVLSAAARLGSSYSSLGASTAVFAGLGILTGNAIRTRLNVTPDSLRSLFVPLGAGATVLALYGAGGSHVDLGAHLCGFLVGLVLGHLPRRP